MIRLPKGLFCLCVFLQTGFLHNCPDLSWLALNSQRLVCLSLPSAGTKGVCHHCLAGMIKVLNSWTKSQIVFVSKLSTKDQFSKEFRL